MRKKLAELQLGAIDVVCCLFAVAVVVFLVFYGPPMP